MYDVTAVINNTSARQQLGLSVCMSSTWSTANSICKILYVGLYTYLFRISILKEIVHCYNKARIFMEKTPWTKRYLIHAGLRPPVNVRVGSAPVIDLKTINIEMHETSLDYWVINLLRLFVINIRRCRSVCRVNDDISWNNVMPYT